MIHGFSVTVNSISVSRAVWSWLKFFLLSLYV